MSAEDITLFSSDLLSKWGFRDGDLLDDPIWDRCDEFGGFYGGDTHRVLIRAVREYLLPALAVHHEIVVFEIDTIHNPIRAEYVDGIEIAHFDPGVEIPMIPESVTVPFDAIWGWWLETLPGDPETTA